MFLEHRGSQRDSQRLTEKISRVLSQRTRRTTKGHKGDGTAQGTGRACAQGARPARRPVGHGGLRTPCFGFWKSSDGAPSYRSYMSYWSYRVVLWHVADVPGGRGRGKWKFGSLDAWKFGFLVVQLFRLSPACRAFCSPFSRARKRPSPAGVWGSAPHLLISQSANFFVSLVVLCVLCGETHWQASLCSSVHPSVCLCDLNVSCFAPLCYNAEKDERNQT